MYKLIHATVVLPMQNGSNNSLPQSIKSTNHRPVMGNRSFIPRKLTLGRFLSPQNRQMAKLRVLQ